MTQHQKMATVFGGTGFVGTQIVYALAKAGYAIKIATRVPERAYFLRPCGNVGQVVPLACNYSDPKSIAKAVQGSDVVVNCIGALFEKGEQSFQKAHIDIPAAIAKSCADYNVDRFVHISALACDRGTSKYAKSKYKGEEAIHAQYPSAIILRPSVIFGEGDDFFNMFAKMATILPILPLIGGGETQFQPVYVGDVVDATMAAVNTPDADGKIYALGGPEILSFKQIFERLFSYTGQTPILLSLPFGLAKIQAAFLSMLPKPLLTRDQVESLKTDNIVTNDELTLSDLGVNPTALDIILPTYLVRYRAGGRFGTVENA